MKELTEKEYRCLVIGFFVGAILSTVVGLLTIDSEFKAHRAKRQVPVTQIEK